MAQTNGLKGSDHHSNGLTIYHSKGSSEVNGNGYIQEKGHGDLQYAQTNGAKTNGHAGEPHPFVYRLYPTFTDRLIWAVMALTLFPIKALLLLLFLVLAWIPAAIAVWNWPIQSPVPFTGWRVVLKDITVFFVRCAWFCGGINRQIVKGKQLSSKEAPIIVLGPHSSLVDTLAGAICGFPGVVSITDNAKLPIIGTLFRVNQSIFVERGDPNSRSNTAHEIKRRAESGGTWPQLVVFPEGFCCNRTCLLPYKPGAFLPGLSVQPVLIRYPNRLDTTTWINTGPGMLAVMTLLLCTPVTTIEVEFLPVYHPSEEEKSDPELYMNNVRVLMSKSLGVPLTEKSHSDLMALVKSSKPNRGVFALWKNIFTKGSIEMPHSSKLS